MGSSPTGGSKEFHVDIHIPKTVTIGVVAAQSGRDGWGKFESCVVSLPLCHVYSRFSVASRNGASCARMV